MHATAGLCSYGANRTTFALVAALMPHAPAACLPFSAFLAQQDTSYEKHRASNSASSHINDTISMSRLRNIYRKCLSSSTIILLIPKSHMSRDHNIPTLCALMRDFASHRLFRIARSNEGLLGWPLRMPRIVPPEYFHTGSKFLSVSAFVEAQPF
jgi:hypothetical protein